jgi:hypothetical protein
MFEFEKDTFQNDLKEAEFKYTGICKLDMSGTPSIIRDEVNRDIMAPDGHDMYHAIRTTSQGNIPDWFIITDLEKFMLFGGSKEHKDGTIKVRYNYARDMTEEELAVCQSTVVEIITDKINELI